MNILIVKTSSMGDILHTLPALTDAMKVFPKISFDWVIEENFIEIPRWHPAVCNVIPVSIRRWRKSLFCLSTYREYINFIHLLQRKKYNFVIDAQGLIKSAILITFFAKGIKVGLDFFNVKESISSFFYDRVYKISRKQHPVENIRQLFSKTINYELPRSIGDFHIVKNFNKNQIINKKELFLVFIYSTTKIEKHWPERYWRDLIFLVEKMKKYKIKIIHDPNNKYQSSYRISQGFSCVSLLFLHSLKEIAMELYYSKAVVSVDTGFGHLSNALHLPNLILCGPTDPNLIFSYGNYQRVLHSKNKKMNHLNVMYVWSILNQILDSS